MKKRFEFVQVEAGISHTLLLNTRGEVYSFGEGLQGQVGIGSKIIQSHQPTQLCFNNEAKDNEKIAKITASGYNSAAFNKEGKLWVWGGTSRGKLGVSSTVRDQSSPVQIEFEIKYNDKKDEIVCEAFLDENKNHRKINTEYIINFQSIAWGIDHCVFVDKESRVFSMGFGRHGRLGHDDEKDRKKPTLIKELEGKKIKDVQAGYYHSLAVNSKGEIYTWGIGHMGRLGLGYDEESRTNKNQLIPKKIDEVFDDAQIINVSCGKVINGVTLKTGTLMTWGKGEHEKPKFDDFIEYSVPFPMIEDKNIIYVSCGASHAMAIDINGRIYGWGDGEFGCLGLGDGKRRLSVVPISFFEDKRCIDVACGEKFTVVIAEVYSQQVIQNQIESTSNEQMSLADIKNFSKLNKLKNQKDQLKSWRKPLSGGDNISYALRDKIQQVIQKNNQRTISSNISRNGMQTDDQLSPDKLKLPMISNLNPQVFNTIDVSSRSEVKKIQPLLTNIPQNVRKIKLNDFPYQDQPHINSTVKDIIQKTHGQKQYDTERALNKTYDNELINDDSISYYIQSSFKTRGQTPLKNSRWKTAFYVDEVCGDKNKIMKKLRKINYNDYFSNGFQISKIDTQFKELENKEKVRVINNVIDLLFLDQKALKKKKRRGSTITKEEKLEKRQKELGLQPQNHFDQVIANDPNRVTNYSPFLADINLIKLRKKKILMSPSIVYKRPDTKLFIGGNTLRSINKNEARAKSIMR